MTWTVRDSECSSRLLAFQSLQAFGLVMYAVLVSVSGFVLFCFVFFGCFVFVFVFCFLLFLCFAHCGKSRAVNRGGLLEAKAPRVVVCRQP